jgi:glyoxylase-like metal-dependent hydrolase (beta-lactamase superfamily II)
VPAPIVLLAPGVYRIPTMGDFVNSFALLDADGQVTLVDCGLDRAPRRIVAALAGIGKHPQDVTRIVLTHAHPDHAGGAADLVGCSRTPGVEVHSDDAAYVRTGTSAPWGSITAGRLFGRGSAGTFTAAPVTTELSDGDVLDIAGGVRVVHTPGHTPGHISLLLEDSGVLITGDAIFNMRARMRWPLAMVCTSAHLNRISAHVLGELDYSVAAFTHGPEIRDGAREQIREFLRRAA